MLLADEGGTPLRRFTAKVLKDSELFVLKQKDLLEALGEHQKLMKNLFYRSQKKTEKILEIKDKAKAASERHEKVKISQLSLRKISTHLSTADCEDSNSYDNLFKKVKSHLHLSNEYLRQLETAGKNNLVFFHAQKNRFNKAIEEKDGLIAKSEGSTFLNSESKQDKNCEIGRERDGYNTSFDSVKVQITDMEGLEETENNPNRHSIHLRCLNHTPSFRIDQPSQNHYLSPNYSPNKTKIQFPYQ